ncbi:hypothetical protein QBC47DRAFT_403457 [Echria macrotheca]|uniref:Uncharacterized protein n=1 Tax=Echria macrotheca TaxID=438768 RepID=A0AAJ0B9A1_9PEZI|nr:hypothetical protein QBC47DRAFT_403457 [Echria macrotheca]
MKLLNVKTLRMEQFGDDRPGYIILSRTRGPDEVSFQDWQTISLADDLVNETEEYSPGSYVAVQLRKAAFIKNKSSYQKVISFCNETARHESGAE